MCTKVIHISQLSFYQLEEEILLMKFLIFIILFIKGKIYLVPYGCVKLKQYPDNTQIP